MNNNRLTVFFAYFVNVCHRNGVVKSRARQQTENRIMARTQAPIWRGSGEEGHAQCEASLSQ